MLPVIFYGCKTWSLTLRLEDWLNSEEERGSDNETGGIYVSKKCGLLFLGNKKGKDHSEDLSIDGSALL
jgi:hypothetical protein